MPLAWVRTPKLITLGVAATSLLGPDAAASPCRASQQMAPMPAQGKSMGPAKANQTSTMQVAPGLVVQYEVGEFDVETQTWSFRKGVVAAYGLTTLHSDTLVVHLAPGQEAAEAAGNVELDDPAGLVTADSLNFSWKLGARGATARRVMIHIGNVMLEAARAEMKPDRWDLYDVDATNCKESRPLFAVHTPHLTIHPGSSGIIRRPTLKVLGYKIVTAPDQTFNLNPRTQGLQYPNFSYHAGQGIGVSFKSGFLVTPTTDLAVSYGAIHGSLPGYGAIVTSSLLPNAATRSIPTPTSDFSERFHYGFLENVQVRTPSEETRYLQASRSSVSVATAWNGFVEDRPDSIAYTKPIEGIYEAGGASGAFGFLGQARFQSIQRYRQALHERMILTGSVAPNPRTIAPNLSTLVRVDSEAFAGNDFGWLRGIAGLTYHPIAQLTVSGGGFASMTYGQPLYTIDELYAREGLVARVDVDLGATKLSYMAKWDTNLGIFDHEYTIRQVVGCLEPFLEARQLPRSYNLGFRLRLDEFYDVLRRRHFERPAGPPPPPMVISQ